MVVPLSQVYEYIYPRTHVYSKPKTLITHLRHRVREGDPLACRAAQSRDLLVSNFHATDPKLYACDQQQTFEQSQDLASLRWRLQRYAQPRVRTCMHGHFLRSPRADQSPMGNILSPSHHQGSPCTCKQPPSSDSRFMVKETMFTNRAGWRQRASQRARGRRREVSCADV